MHQLIKSVALLAATAPLMLALPAHADYPHGPGRDGVTAGVALGGGSLTCSADGCEDLNGAGSFDFHVGGMIDPMLAAVGELWWMVHTENDLTVDQAILTAALRFWPTHNLWLQLGLGAARAGYSYAGALATFEDHTEWVPAFAIGIGVEPIATDSFALDVALRYGTGFYSDGDYRIHSLALTVGVAFY